MGHHSKPNRNVGAVLEAHFWDKVEPEPMSGCHLWVGARTDDGYGVIAVNGRNKRAHRVAWEMRNGPVPKGLKVLHKCNTPPCVWHLYVGTHGDNAADMIAAGRHWVPYGERSNLAKLTRTQVLEIRLRLDEGGDARAAAEQYGVHVAHVRAIGRRKFWRWLEEEKPCVGV